MDCGGLDTVAAKIEVEDVREANAGIKFECLRMTPVPLRTIRCASRSKALR